jgi:urease accessory protein
MAGMPTITRTTMRMTTTTVMTTRMAMATIATEPLPAATLLKLMWLASPALPVGGFSYSEGLEAAVESGRVKDEASAGIWLRDQLSLALGRSELPLVAQAHAAWRDGDLPRAAALNDWQRCTRESSEMRLQAEQMGRSLHDWLRQRAPEDPRVAFLGSLSPAPTWPLAFALAAVLAGAPAREALLSFAFGWAENMVQAALKAVPLGQSAGQRLLASLVEAIEPAVEAALALPDDSRQAFTPMLAIASAQHEAQYSRLFRS